MAGDDNKNEARGRLTVRKRPAPTAAPPRIEPVLGEGPVRRIVFEEERTYRPVEATTEPEPEPTPAPEPEPEPRADPQPDRFSALPSRRRGHWDIETIHREVDRMHRNRTWGRIEFGIDQPGTIYRTTRGAVRESRAGDHEKRLLYVSEGEGSSRRESRFISTLVDRVISGIDGPTPSERAIDRSLGRGGHAGRTEVYERTVVRETTRTAPGSRASGRSTRSDEAEETTGHDDDANGSAATNGRGGHASPTLRRSRTTVEESIESSRSTSRSTSRSDARTGAAGAPDVAPRLQETGPKAQGTRVSSGSSRKTASPAATKAKPKKSAKGAAKSPATRPTKSPAKSPTKSAAKSTATGNAKGTPDRAYQEQCVALTNDGVQCRNSSRQGSKYCASHRNYRARGSPALREKLDTPPVHPKAKDTKPAVRKK